MSESGSHVSDLRIADPDGLVGAIRGSELEPWLLSGHRTESHLSQILLPGSCLDQAKIGPAMWFRGAMPKDCYTMVYVTTCPEEGHSFNFNSRHRDRCLGFFAPGEILDAKIPEGYGHGTLTIPEMVFLQAVESRYPEFPEKLLTRGRSIFPREVACQNLMSLLDAVAATIDRTPEVFGSEVARHALENELHDHFFDLITGDGGSATGSANPGISRRYQKMNLVRDFIRENSHRRILLHELCTVSGLSRRGLEYLFVDLLGIRAKEFLQQLRLRGARQELLASEPRHGQVKHSALNWGFWHHGRFAAEYQALFDEMPSETLSRQTNI